MEYTTKQLLSLRKVTRAIQDLFYGQLKDHLATLTPLFRARSILGEFIQSRSKEAVKGSERIFKDMQSLHEAIVSAKPFNLPKGLNPPLEIQSCLLELSVMDYTHVARTEGDSKKVTITSPLRWLLSYQGYGLSRLREIVTNPNRIPESNSFIIHALLIHVILENQPGICRMLESLHFPVSTIKLPEFGELPMTVISSSLSTIRPPDNIII